MMNGAKKSDSSIVPAKLANKAKRSAAESVEGDDGTKRNAELQSTVRTQSREAVTQAQARIRGAVTRNKKEKLTALLHHVSIGVLRWAFFNLKKRAAPGADGLTWADYAADLDRNLIQRRLMACSAIDVGTGIDRVGQHMVDGGVACLDP